MSDDFLVDDLVAENKKMKKKINCGRKGKRTEREIVKILSDKFGEVFSRTVGSGNRWAQVSHLPKHAMETFTGDLVTPENFLFVVESKGGYDEVDLDYAFVDGHSRIDEFLEQVSFESGRSGKKPLVVWKKNRKPWLAIIKTADLPIDFNCKYKFIYGEWSVMALDQLLALPKDFFFTQKC